MPEISGFTTGRTTANYAGAGDQIPLLSGFYFRFDKVGDRVDNEINSIMVLPGGVSADLSPDADLSPSAVEEDSVDVMFADSSPSGSTDRYQYKVRHVLKSADSVSRYQFRDVGCTGKCVQQLPRAVSSGTADIVGHVFVLCGFRLFFTGNRDNHIDVIGVHEENGQLTVEFNDKNDDNVFGYIVDYAWVSRTSQSIRVGEERGTASGGAEVPAPGVDKVICGFRFDFRQTDKQLREIGVLSTNERIQVFFGDKSPTDSFHWMVRWATISPMVVQ